MSQIRPAAKSRLLSTVFLSTVVAAAAQGARAADTATLSDHVSGWVSSATRIGAAPDAQRVSIVVHMALRNKAALEQLVAAVSTPGSTQYGHYLTPAAIRAQFAPAAADVAEIAGMMTAAGLSNVRTGPFGAYIAADASVSQIRQIFGIDQDLYSYRGMTLRGTTQQPTVPASIAGKIVYIEGLDDTTFLKTPMHHSATSGDAVAPAATGRSGAAAVTPPPVAASLPSPYCATYYNDTTATLSTPPTPYPATLSWLICGYTPQQIQAAYGFDRVKFDGTGVTVAIIDAFASPTLLADGNRYAAKHNLPKLTSRNFTQIIPQGIYNVPADQVTNAYGWWGEQSLDLAAVHGSAPGASIVYIGSTDNGSSLTTALLDAIYNKKADIITNSYSFNGEGGVAAADYAMQDQAFMAAAAAGITLLFSSGDDGDLSQLNGVATGSYESTSPYVTAVGGTSLGVLDASGAKYEAGWGTYRAYLAGAHVNSASSITTSGVATATVLGTAQDAYAFYAGAGGGISIVEPQPSYQASVVPSALATQLNLGNGSVIPLTPRRVSPDIAMVADPYTGYLFGQTFTIAGNAAADSGCTPLTATTEYCENSIGGTSLASPLMAGVTAVVNHARLKAGVPLVGFANPLLYSLNTGTTLTSGGFNQVMPPGGPTALLRGYSTDPTRVRVVTVNSVPMNAVATPFPLQVCGQAICEGLNDVFNVVTPGYNDVTGIGVPWLPNLMP